MSRNKGNNRYNRKRCMVVICNIIAHSDMSLEDICKSKPYFPAPSAVVRWVSEGGALSEWYALAKDRQADYVAHQIVSIADSEDNPNKARNMIDARKWLASKLNPRKYGDKIELNGSLEMVQNDPASLETALALSALLNGIAKRAGIELLPPPAIEHKP